MLTPSDGPVRSRSASQRSIRHCRCFVRRMEWSRRRVRSAGQLPAKVHPTAQLSRAGIRYVSNTERRSAQAILTCCHTCAGKIPPQGSNKDIFVVLAIVVFVFFFFFYKRRSGEGQARGGGSGFWGGFGGGGDGGYPPSGPPPPYQPYPKPEPGTSTGANTQSAWRPGFWSGLASGALGAEAARRLREANQPDYAATARRRTFFDSDVDSFGFGGGGSNAFGPAGSSRSSGRESGETRTAYGYGGSSVR